VLVTVPGPTHPLGGVIKRLQGRRIPVIALANPLRSVASDSAYVASVLDHHPRTARAVGHSYGGMVITNAARSPQTRSIQALVYVAHSSLRW